MKKIISLLAASLIAHNVSCESSRGKVKPNPDKKNFTRCPVCDGYGKIVIQSIVKDKKKSDIDENSACYNAMACTSCFFALGWEVAHRDDMEYKNRETDNQIRDMENSVYNLQSHDSINPPVYHSHRSGRKKTVKCHRCNGVGWINKYEYTIMPMYNENNIDDIIRANELLDKQN